MPESGSAANGAMWVNRGGVGTGALAGCGVSLDGPAAVYSGTTSHVFVVGGDGAVWMRSDAGAGWSALWVFDTRTPGGPYLWNHTWQSLGGYILN